MQPLHLPIISITSRTSILEQPAVLSHGICGRDSRSFEVLGFGATVHVYRYKTLAYKQACLQRELDMMKRAGDWAVRPVARDMDTDRGNLVMNGLLMDVRIKVSGYPNKQ